MTTKTTPSSAPPAGPLTLAESTARYKRHNDSRARVLGVPVPTSPVPIAALPATLRAMNDGRQARQTPFDGTEPITSSTPFGAEQETARLAILQAADGLLARTRVSRDTELAEDAAIFANAVREYMAALGSTDRGVRRRGLEVMRAAVERMSAVQRGEEK